MFRPPTQGYEDPPMSDTVHDYMIRKPSATLLMLIETPYPPFNLQPGDLVVVEKGRALYDRCHVLADLDGERFYCELFYKQGRWFAKAGERTGYVRPEMEIVGVMTKTAKNQIPD